MNEPYEGIITIPVSIPAAVVEDDADAWTVMTHCLDEAEEQFWLLVDAFRAAR